MGMKLEAKIMDKKGKGSIPLTSLPEK